MTHTVSAEPQISSEQQQTVHLLKQAYEKEMETVANYLAMSVNLNGVRAEEIKRALAEDINDELQHARQLAQRIKQLGGVVPGSLQLEFSQQTLQVPERLTDVLTAIRGVLDAERDAIETYSKIIRHTDGTDFVTVDLATDILADEEEHRVLFEGFLAEYEEQS